MILFYQYLVLVFMLFTTSIQQQLKDCFAIRGDANTITCRSIPKCKDEHTLSIFSQYTRIVFDLENTYTIESENFFNCSLSWSNQINLEFKNIRLVNKFAFELMKIEKNVRLNIRFDGTGLNLAKSVTSNTQKILIRRDAFKNVELMRNSQLNIEIKGYKSVYIQDILVDSILQDETSELNLSIRNCDQLFIKNKNEKNKQSLEWLNEFNLLDETNDSYEAKHLNPNHDIPLLKGNLSFTLEMIRLNSVIIDQQVFAGLQVNPYSDMSIVIKLVNQVSLGTGAFDSLMLGSYSQFNFLIETVSLISLGKRLFNSLQQEQTSVFFFQMDQIGDPGTSNHMATTTTTTTTPTGYSSDYEYYDDYELNADYPTSEKSNSQYSNWLCLPEGFFRNVQHYESALTQIHLTKIYMSVSVSSWAFNEIQLSENSKFQILFEDVRGHIMFDKDAVNLVKVSDGLFEIWNENHMQQETLAGNQRFDLIKTTTTSSSFKTKSKKKSFLDVFKLMKSVKHVYFKLLDYSINQIFLTPRSDFRIGYVNSASIFILRPRSLNGFHIDRFDSSQSLVTNNQKDKRKDYNVLTKITLKIDENSENFKFNFGNDITSEEEHQLKSINLPKIIDIDGFEPTLYEIKPDGSFTKIIKKDLKSDTFMSEEFCRFYKLKQFMSEIEYEQKQSKTIYKLTNNLVYFSQLNKNSMKIDSQMQCTSCLLIYLYRTIHRRPDFYFVKDNLPLCFINLHFKGSMYFPSSADAKNKQELIDNIEKSFKKYWKELRCSETTGLNNILEYDSTKNEMDETQSDYDRIETHCRPLYSSKKFNDEINAVKNFEDWNWHENAEKICVKNLADTTLSEYVLNSTNPQLSLRKSNKIGPRPILNDDTISSATTEEHSSTLTVVLITGLITFSLSLLIFGYVKYKQPKRPCIRLNFRRHSANKNFQRLNNCKNSTHSLNVNRLNSKTDENNDDDDEDPVTNSEHTAYDELNGYEYDDEFEIQNPDTNETTNVHSRINKDHQLPYTTEMENAHGTMTEDDFNQYSTPYSNSITKLGRITSKSLQHIKRIKTNLLSKDGFLKNVTNLNHPHFKQAQKHLFSKTGTKGNYPHYTYNSTDSTLIQTRIPNEFQIATTSNLKDESLELDNVHKDGKSLSVVTYDVEKKKSRQNVVKDTYNLLLGTDPNLDKDEYKVMRLSTNPLDALNMEVDYNDKNTVKNNENESTA